jgi:hypothetical protein
MRDRSPRTAALLVVWWVEPSGSPAILRVEGLSQWRAAGLREARVRLRPEEPLPQPGQEQRGPAPQSSLVARSVSAARARLELRAALRTAEALLDSLEALRDRHPSVVVEEGQPSMPVVVPALLQRQRAVVDSLQRALARLEPPPSPSLEERWQQAWEEAYAEPAAAAPRMAAVPPLSVVEQRQILQAFESAAQQWQPERAVEKRRLISGDPAVESRLLLEAALAPAWRPVSAAEVLRLWVERHEH